MSDDDGVPLRQRAAGAAVAACVSAVVVNPLDVVKTRIQAQGAFPTVKPPGGGGFDARPALVGADHVCPPRCPTTGNLSKLCAPECNVYTSTYDVLRKIWRQEGPAALFRGTSTALAIAVPTVGIYLPCYDVCVRELKRRLGASEWGREYAPLAPVAAGAASRTLAVLCVAPLDLVRVRTQAMKTGGGGGGNGGEGGGGGGGGGGGARGGSRVPGLWQGLAASAAGDRGASSEGSNGIWKNGTRRIGVVRRLWTGVAPTLARDVPYSAAYWLAVETLRDDLTRRVRVARGGDGGGGDSRSDGGDSRSDERPGGGSSHSSQCEPGPREAPLSRGDMLRVNFISGVCAGALTAALTTPLDVVKTRVQIRDAPKDFAGGIPVDGPGGAGAVPDRARTSRGRRGVLAELGAVAREGGARALFAGWAPRAIRAGPTCGIVLVAYEFAKTWQM